MTVPDALAITEVVLYSYGFAHATSMARKVTKLYEAAKTSFSDAVSAGLLMMLVRMLSEQ